MSGMFTRARRSNRKLRLALCGISGSGKTMSALKIARGICDWIRETEGRVARIGVIDTENGSAELYAGEFYFDVCKLGNFRPDNYVAAIKEAEKYFDVIVIDSLSHAWTGEGGVLPQVDEIAKANRGNSFGAWRTVTPQHNALVDAMIRSPRHIIGTMRTKVEYAQEADVRGKTTIKKLGMAPIQREGMDYEFDVVGDLNQEHELIVTKSRYSPFANRVFGRPGEPIGAELARWLCSPQGPREEESDTVAMAGPVATPAGGRPAPVPAPASSEPTPEATPEADSPPMGVATAHQVARIYDLFGFLRMDDAAVQKALAARGVSRVDSLSGPQAAEMIRRMEGVLEQRKLKEEQRKLAEMEDHQRRLAETQPELSAGIDELVGRLSSPEEPGESSPDRPGDGAENGEPSSHGPIGDGKVSDSLTTPPGPAGEGSLTKTSDHEPPSGDPEDVDDLIVPDVIRPELATKPARGRKKAGPATVEPATA